MSKRESISRYNLIIKKLRKSPSTFEEIDDYLSRESELQSYNFNVSKRTFQRDLDDIRSLFNIDIQYDFTRRCYSIIDEENPEANERILEAFDTFNALNVSDGLSKYIHFEKRRPQGTENLYGLLHAIKNRLQINYVYHKFWEEEPVKRSAEPFGLKEFKNRWYVISRDLKDDKIKTFALDRLTCLEITKKKFIFPKDYNIEDSFRFCFGIISPNDEKPQDIVLSFDPFQGKYIKTLPLHETQQVLIDNKDELQIKLKLCVTHDLVMELLSYGDNLTVLKPKALVKQMKSILEKTLKSYDN